MEKDKVKEIILTTARRLLDARGYVLPTEVSTVTGISIYQSSGILTAHYQELGKDVKEKFVRVPNAPGHRKFRKAYYNTKKAPEMIGPVTHMPSIRTLQLETRKMDRAMRERQMDIYFEEVGNY